MAWVAIGAAAVSTVGGALLSDNSGANASSQAAADASKQQAAIAQDQWDRYKSVYGPLEDDYVNQSKNVGSIANQNKAAEQASADVEGSYAKARENLDTTPGANPSSQAYIQEQNRINLGEAASSAAAQTGARQVVQDKGRAAMTDAVSLGKGLPANASTMLASSAQGLNAAGQYAQNRSDKAAGNFGQMVGGITSKIASALPGAPYDPTTQTGGFAGTSNAPFFYGNGTSGD